MLIAPEIRFRGVERTPALEAALLCEAEALERHCDKITSCRVLLEVSHHHQRSGGLYHVRVDITVPGREIVVCRAPDEHQGHEEMDVAVRDAFDAAARQLDDYVRERRGVTKVHVRPPRARVLRVFPDLGYGFLQTLEGGEVYFHRNCVRGIDFDVLEPGTEVRYAVEDGTDGPQATMVRPARHRARSPTLRTA